MKTIGAGAFKTQCLALLDQVQETGEPILVTKRGIPVARVVPPHEKKPERVLGCMKGRFRIVGDITEPLMTDEEVAQWERDWEELNK
jgi:prevent-host-death family protein